MSRFLEGPRLAVSTREGQELAKLMDDATDASGLLWAILLKNSLQLEFCQNSAQVRKLYPTITMLELYLYTANKWIFPFSGVFQQNRATPASGLTSAPAPLAETYPTPSAPIPYSPPPHSGKAAIGPTVCWDGDGFLVGAAV